MIFIHLLFIRVGFNSVYHLTDLPSFVSGKHVVLFDPQGVYLPMFLLQTLESELNMLVLQLFQGIKISFFHIVPLVAT